ncbi:hypothetical protein [Luteipulveratus mongoliensis]|uniref:hypothetical protein n=1 Tax=Luteipulveratus mongoliensis TaxID=571913 RepID=UPI00069877BC|nr:hypothetical protein [Luteipulveratus mongoliensis]
MALAPPHRAPRASALLPARASGDVRRISLTWQQPGSFDAASFTVHGQRVHKSPAPRLRPSEDHLLATVREPLFLHHGLAPQGERWEYLVQALDRAGAVQAASDAVEATSRTSVTVTGHPVATVGSFNGQGLELALSPSGFVRYQSVFPADVDFTHGRDRADTSWSYLQPGPDDAWAGRRGHRFRLRFWLDEQPEDDLDLALWLTDRHPVRAGAAGLLVNGRRLDPLIFADEVEPPETPAGGDVPGHGAGPAYIERSLRRGLFVAGENILEIVKDQGSWIAYDALGIFARTAPAF